MFNYLRRQFNWRIYRCILLVLVIIILVVATFSECGTTSATQLYENSQLGIAFEYQENWNVETSKRVDNLVVIQSKKGLLEQNSTRIRLLVNSPNSVSLDLEERLENRINSIGRLYDLESVTIVQPPTRIEGLDYEVVVATVAIPTMAIPKNSPANQMGHRDAHTVQLIDMYVIRNNDNRSVGVNIYRGESDNLNTQAEAIIKSIRFIAANTP